MTRLEIFENLVEPLKLKEKLSPSEYDFLLSRITKYIEQISQPLDCKVSNANDGFNVHDKVERARIFMMDVAWAKDGTMTAKEAREIITRVYGKEVMEEVLSRLSR